MSRLHLAVLGGFQLRAESRAVTLPAKKAQGLLAYLALRPDHPHSRESLVGLLWGNASEERARHSLRQTVFRLRQVFRAAKNTGLSVRGDTVSVDAAAVALDAREFQRLVRTGTPRALETALALYRGPLLDGLHVGEAAFDEWLHAERERFQESVLAALAKLLGHQLHGGAVEAAVDTATRLLALDPLQEGAHRALMRLYAKQGRRAHALRHYQVCVETLRRELGVEPEAETRRVYQDILQHQRGPARARPEVLALEPRLVGREAELARLHRALDETCGGSGRTVLVVGEAGIGKSRLLGEVTATALQRGARLMVGRCYETEQILPFGPWVEVLRAALGLLEGAAIERIDPVWRAELARLLPELTAPDVEAARSGDDYLRLFRAVAQVLELLAAERPLVLVVEDLHWADEMSVRLFGFLARRVAACPCLLLGSARAEELGEAPLLRRLLEELRDQRDGAPLTLGSLSKEETHRLVHVVARAGVPPSALGQVAKQVWTLSEGNPFVAVETMRAFNEGHRPDTAGIGLPARVREAIGGRLDRLSARGRELVAVAAVIGREFDFALLHCAARLDADEAAAGVEELVRRGVLHGVGARLDFVHDRIREVAYQQTFPPRRVLLHAAVADAIEAVYADDLDAHAGALGVHYRCGEVWDKAARYLREAGTRAVAYSAYREAIAYFDQALEVLRHLPDGRSRIEQAYNLGFNRASVYYSLGDFRRVTEYLDEAERLVHALDDRDRQARLDVLRLGTLAAMGEQPPAIAAGERALAIATELGNVLVQASATFLLGFAHTGLGAFQRAVGYMKQSGARLEGYALHRRLGQIGLPAVLWRAWMLLPLAELGEFAEGIARGEEAIQIAESAGQPYSVALAHGTLGYLYCVKGEPSLALGTLQRSVTVCRDYEIAVLSAFMLGMLGHAHVLAGDVAPALPMLEQAVERGASMQVMFGQSRLLTHLGDGYLRAGRLDDALKTIEAALAEADVHGERGNRAYALRCRAEIARSRERADLERAERDVCAALALAEELAMRPLAARCRLDLAGMQRRGGSAA